MSTTLTTSAIEKSTYVITCAFKNEDNEAVIPNSGLTWTLTDLNGVVINSRENVAISSASTVYIVLSGNDLQIINSAKSSEDRLITVEGTYNSDLGTNLPIKQVVRFTITNEKKII